MHTWCVFISSTVKGTIKKGKALIDRIITFTIHCGELLQQVVPLYIKSATVYYGRLVRQDDARFEKLSSQMAAHYAIERRWATEVVEGELYAFQLEDEYHRSVPDVP